MLKMFNVEKWFHPQLLMLDRNIKHQTSRNQPNFPCSEKGAWKLRMASSKCLATWNQRAMAIFATEGAGKNQCQDITRYRNGLQESGNSLHPFRRKRVLATLQAEFWDTPLIVPKGLFIDPSTILKYPKKSEFINDRKRPQILLAND